MPAIHARWNLGIYLRFVNNLSKYADLLILSDQNWTFAPIYRKSTALESKSFWWEWSIKIMPTRYAR